MVVPALLIYALWIGDYRMRRRYGTVHVRDSERNTSGLMLNKHGKLTGTPTQVIDTTVMIKLKDAANCSINQAFAIRVVAPPRRPVVVHKSSH